MIESPAWLKQRRTEWWSFVPFVLCHIAALGAIWSGVSASAVVVALVLFLVRMWGVTAGYHRYFSHRAFKTSRTFQFLLAFLAQTSGQKGALWWAAHHRRHHKHSDAEGDIHSPVRDGFWHAHLGWMFLQGSDDTDFARIPDFAKYPELVWLNRFALLPAAMLGVATLALFGAPGLIVGFFWSTVALWHSTFLINSLAHVFGRRRFDTGDASRNNWLLALLTLGEGWHNNHHRYQSAARNGFYWWEIDVTYYVLKVLAALGIVWDLRPVPTHVLELGRRLDREQVALSPPPARVSG